MGKTYDAEFLRRVGAQGIQADQAASAAWFRKARSLAVGKPDKAAIVKQADAFFARTGLPVEAPAAAASPARDSSVAKG